MAAKQTMSQTAGWRRECGGMASQRADLERGAEKVAGRRERQDWRRWRRERA